jgi:tetratricopeptide (TPR) repeat protein
VSARDLHHPRLYVHALIIETPMREWLKAKFPPVLKVMRTRYGLRSLADSSLRLWVVVAGGAVVGYVASWTGRCGPTLFAAMVALLGVFALKGFDLVGRMFICQAVVHENMSQSREACRAYMVALCLLSNRVEALCGLVSAASNRVRTRYLRKLSQLTRGTRDVGTARFVAAAMEEFAGIDEALGYFCSLHHLKDAGLATAEARILLKKGFPQKSLERIGEVQASAESGELHYVCSRALSALGHDEEALDRIDRAIRLRGYNAKYHSERGAILERLCRRHEALGSLDRSIFLHEKNPEALYRKGLLCAKLGRVRGARRSLRRCLFYDNMNTPAFLKLEALEGRSQGFIYDQDLPENAIALAVVPLESKVLVGEDVELGIKVSSTRSIERCSLTALEPYGGGLEVESPRLYIGRLEPRVPFITKVRVAAKRPSTVNLGSAWRLNFVLTCSDGWKSVVTVIDVIDSRPGEIFLILSEDHEIAARERKPLHANEARLDLVQKARIAHLIARDYGVKWTHMIDAGTGLAIVQWAAERSEGWSPLRRDLVSFYEEAYAAGHDIQLHLHLSAVPNSSFFCYRYDPETDTLLFDIRKKNLNRPRPQITSWASVVSMYGRAGDQDSRLGSVAHARYRITGILSARFPAYAPVFFRAGQWDFGNSLAEREKSFLALRENGILADSSATQGNPLDTERFGFGSPPLKSCYFTREADINERARVLSECGITEALPLVHPQGKHAVTPRDNPRVVIRAYNRFVKNGAVCPGRHVLMEMEHICAIDDTANSRAPVHGKNQRASVGWRAMRRHFHEIRRECPFLRFAGAREALESWWDYYSPQLIGLPLDLRATSHALVDGLQVAFPLRFLGTKTVGKKTRRMPVIIPLPSVGQEGATRVRIMRGQTVMWSCRTWAKKVIKTDIPMASSTIGDFRLEITVERPIARKELSQSPQEESCSKP